MIFRAKGELTDVMHSGDVEYDENLGGRRCMSSGDQRDFI